MEKEQATEDMLLLINSLIEGDFSNLLKKLEIAGVMGLIVLIAIGIDLVSGVRKAKKLGLARTSVGLRETVKKVIQYLTVILFGLMIDVLISKLLDWPYVTMALCVGLVVIEGISVWEKAEVKLKKKVSSNIDGLADILANVQNKDAMLKAIANILKENITEDE